MTCHCQLPASLLHTRQISSERIHSKLELRPWLAYSAFVEVKDTTHSTHSEVTEDTSTPASHCTSVLDLCESCVAMHLGKLQLGLGSDTLRIRRITNDISKRLSTGNMLLAIAFP